MLPMRQSYRWPPNSSCVGLDRGSWLMFCLMGSLIGFSYWSAQGRLVCRSAVRRACLDGCNDDGDPTRLWRPSALLCGDANRGDGEIVANDCLEQLYYRR